MPWLTERSAVGSQVVSAAGADGTHEAVRGGPAVRGELGGLITMRAGHAGAVGAVFLRARCCSTALAAIAWARARILNSWSPKRGASSVVARLARLAGGIGLADFDGGQ